MGHIDASRDVEKQNEYRKALERDIETKRQRVARERFDQDHAKEWWEGESLQHQSGAGGAPQHRQAQHTRFDDPPPAANPYRPQTVGEGRKNQLGGNSMAALLNSSPSQDRFERNDRSPERRAPVASSAQHQQHQQVQQRHHQHYQQQQQQQQRQQYEQRTQQQQRRADADPRGVQPPAEKQQGSLEHAVQRLTFENEELRRRLRMYEQRFGYL